MSNYLITRKGSKIQVNGNLVTGDTYPVKDFLKAYCAARWDKDNKGWRVDVNKLNEIVSRGNHIGLRVDESNDTDTKATGTVATNGWCNKCHSYCWGDCQS